MKPQTRVRLSEPRPLLVATVALAGLLLVLATAAAGRGLAAELTAEQRVIIERVRGEFSTQVDRVERQLELLLWSVEDLFRDAVTAVEADFGVAVDDYRYGADPRRLARELNRISVKLTRLNTAISSAKTRVRASLPGPGSRRARDYRLQRHRYRRRDPVRFATDSVDPSGSSQ